MIQETLGAHGETWAYEIVMYLGKEEIIKKKSNILVNRPSDTVYMIVKVLRMYMLTPQHQEIIRVIATLSLIISKL